MWTHLWKPGTNLKLMEANLFYKIIFQSMILRSGNRRIVKMLTKLVVVKSSSKGLGRREAPEQFSVSLLLVTAEWWPQSVRRAAALLVPAGASAAPSHRLVCSGSSLSRAVKEWAHQHQVRNQGKIVILLIKTDVN